MIQQLFVNPSNVLEVYNKIKRAFACWIIKERKVLDLSDAMISFSFDDVPDSAFSEGRSILKKYGYRGTYYISLGLHENDAPDPVLFDAGLLEEIVAEGGELACHTYNHIHFYNANSQEVIDELEKNQKKMEELIPGYRFSNFSYPYGEQTIPSKMLVQQRFRSARSIRAGINKNPVDLNNLKAMQLDSNLQLEKAFALIEQTRNKKGWLIFYTHDIRNDCSQWGCTPGYFEQVVKYCADRNIKVVTIEKGLDLIQAG
jgi:peptidoglycan/xylan/chitin deacetylase (PgdA/CDA1 family)